MTNPLQATDGTYPLFDLLDEDTETAEAAALKIAEAVYSSGDVVHVCANMSYSRTIGLIVVEVNGGGVDSLYDLHPDDPDPTDLWHVASGDESPDRDNMHPSSHLCTWQRG